MIYRAIDELSENGLQVVPFLNGYLMNGHYYIEDEIINLWKLKKELRKI